ncbi:DNase I-like protein, partial [Thermothelomyces heterothallicus CBS 203.75]
PRRSTTAAVAMAPSTLDLFILTFNCAKNLINPPIFAAHLHGALSQNATGLPDLVVFSLQEVAPLSYAFAGSYFLNPYYARFGEALNLASAKLLAATTTTTPTTPTRATTTTDGRDEDAGPSSPPPYTLVRAKNVGMTAILLYARDPASIQKLEEAECGFGAADMGNKGAVGLRVTTTTTTTKTTTTTTTTELTFVAAHLAAMEWNLKKRNANWRSIVAGLTFANPRSILPGFFPPSRAGPNPDRSGAGDIAPPRLPTGDSPDPSEEEPEEGEEEGGGGAEGAEGADTRPLLPHDPSRDPVTLAALQQISIYKPSSHLFVAGDLNYRIASTTPPPLAAFPSFDPASEHHFAAFLARDQLTRERLAGRTLHGLSEAPIAFGPTYKFDVLPPDENDEASGSVGAGGGREVTGPGEVRWRFAPHRWPGWCDRVLYLDVPRRPATPGSGSSGDGDVVENREQPKQQQQQQQQQTGVEVRAYDALPVMETSDHRAVYFRATVPVLGEDEMRSRLDAAAAAAASYSSSSSSSSSAAAAAVTAVDPRLKMPVPVDVHAWERRAAARRKEMVVGWTGLLWGTREGAVALATVLALGVGSWWLTRVWW